jgi:hypothetical protein
MVLIDEIEDRLTNNSRMIYDDPGYRDAVYEIQELLKQYRKAADKRRTKTLDHFFSDQQ